MIAAATVEAYRKRMRSLAKLSPIEIWYSKIDLVGEIEHIGHRALRRELKKILKKARGHLEEDDNFPHLVKGEPPRIADRRPLIYHLKSQG